MIPQARNDLLVMTPDENRSGAAHVDRGKIIVARQRVIAAGLGTPFAIDLLESFERTQLIFESDLADLLSRKKAKVTPVVISEFQIGGGATQVLSALVCDDS